MNYNYSFFNLCYLTTLVISLFCSTTSSGQIDINKIIPPAPDASALARFVDIPVGHYTGTPGINIPVYEIVDGSIRLDVSLGYHAAGVKVEEIASSVGLSWVLNAGGTITRSVVGIPDETGFIQYAERIQYPINDIGIQSEQEKLSVFTQYVDGCIDPEPDIFFFNFNGFSGRFSFSWNLSEGVVLSSDKKLSILPTFDNNDPYSSIVKWTVVADDGTKYIFEDKERTTSKVVSEGSPLSCGAAPLTYTSSWFLTKVISHNGLNEITINYSDYTINHGFTESEIFVHRLGDGSCPGAFDPSIRITTSTLVTQGKRVQTIKNSTGTEISFERDSHPRADVEGINAFAIKRIRILYKNEPIKDYELNYDYSNGGRLTLKSFVELGENKPPHIFNYNSVQLPPRNSKSQDYWGYFNNNTASHLVPSLAVLYRRTFPETFDYYYFSGADREPDAAKMKAGILEKITYPTKGSVSFEYEPHDYSFVQRDSLEVLQIFALKDTSVTVVKTGDNLNTWNSQVVEFNEKTVVNILTEFSPPPLLGDLSFMFPRVRITDANGILYYQRVYQEGFHSHAILLRPGRYTIMAYAFATQGANADEASIRLSWKKKNTTGVAQKKIQAGGLRVKRITYHDGIDVANDVIENYEYTMAYDSEKSSGALMGEIRRGANDDNSFYFDLVGRLPMFVHEYVTQEKSSISPCHYLNRFSANRAQLGSTSGSHIGYREVVVMRQDGRKTGKTMYAFTSPYDFGDGIINELPFPPSESYDFKRGLLKSKTLFKYNNSDGYKIVNRERYTYAYNVVSIPQLRVAKFQNFGFPSSWDFNYLIYLANYGYANQILKESFDYADNGVNVIHNSTAFDYRLTDKQLKRTFSTGSDGKLMETVYSYPLDFAGSGNRVIDSMLERNMFSVMLKQETFKQQQLVSGKVTEFSLVNSFLFPSKEFSYEISVGGSHNSETILSDRNYKTNLLYDLYNEKGNLLQYRLKDSSPVSLVWGYNSHLPIAKITNAKYSNCFYTSFEDSGYRGDSKTGERYYAGNAYTIPVNKRPVGNDLVMSFWYKKGNGWFFIDNASYSPEVLAPEAEGYDEIRIYPRGAKMDSYSYAPGIGVTSITDFNNKTTYYDYDNLGRLHKVLDEYKNLVKTIEYFFKN